MTQPNIDINRAKSKVVSQSGYSKVLLGYFRKEIYKSVTFVMIAFVGLFAFFDLIAEVDRLSEPGTSWLYYFLSVMLGLPSRIYEIAPIAALIGSIYALVQLAASSEFTAMRAAGLGTSGLIKTVGRISLGIVVLTVLFGEVVAPASERLAVPMRAKALGTQLNKDFRSGYWLRDTFQTETGATHVRFVNFGEFSKDGQLQDVEYYELDDHSKIRSWVLAKTAEFDVQRGDWTLKDVLIQRYYGQAIGNASARDAGLTANASKMEAVPTMQWSSSLTPQLLTGLFVRPERMSAFQLYNYSSFLKRNLQATNDIDLAFAKKVVYPFAILVMMLISLSFAYLHFRSGGISVKVFAGIMIGVGFHLVNNLFSHLSMVAKLPPFLSASLPTLIGFVAGMAALWWVAQPAPWRVLDKFRKRV